MLGTRTQATSQTLIDSIYSLDLESFSNESGEPYTIIFDPLNGGRVYVYQNPGWLPSSIYEGADVALFEVQSGAIAQSVIDTLIEGLEALALALDGWFDPIAEAWDETGYNALIEAFDTVDIEYHNHHKLIRF